MCSNPSNRKLIIRPDFDMDVYLHPPTMRRRRSRQISTSSIDSNDDSNCNNGSPIRRFSFSSIFAYFRQNSSPEFPTLNNTNGIMDKNESSKADHNTVTNYSVKENEIHEILPNEIFGNVQKF